MNAIVSSVQFAISFTILVTCSTELCGFSWVSDRVDDVYIYHFLNRCEDAAPSAPHASVHAAMLAADGGFCSAEGAKTKTDGTACAETQEHVLQPKLLQRVSQKLVSNINRRI